MNIFGTRANPQLEIDPTSPNYDENVKACMEKRRIFVNTQPGSRYIDKKTKKPRIKYKANQVRTSKYTVLTFLPKNLILQFRGIANFYFLVLVVLQAFDLFKTVDVIITALPIVIIVAATAFKVKGSNERMHLKIGGDMLLIQM
jgi:phospholipid-translocating ATPase